MPYCKLCKRGFRESEFDWHLRSHLFEAYFRLSKGFLKHKGKWLGTMLYDCINL